MTYRNLTNEELVNHAEAIVLSEDSNLTQVHKELINELVERFEKVLLSEPSLYSEGTFSKDSNQLELF